MNNRDLEYEKANSIYDYSDESNGIKCKNYEICKGILPEWWFECKDCYYCSNCDMMCLNDLKFGDNIECPICLETQRCVTQPKCDHFICIDCFKRCYHGEDDKTEPKFPFPEIEDEYFDDFENDTNPKWSQYQFDISVWNEQCEEWDYQQMIKYENEEHLHHCCICRK